MYTILAAALLLVPTADADTLPDAIKEAHAAFDKGEHDQAMKLADEIVKAHPKEARAYALRGELREALDRHADAVADFTESLKLDSKQSGLYDRRGSALFKLNRLPEALVDFDQYLKLRPAEAPKHWKRGIVLYYLGLFDDGRKQFASYEKVDTNDVENAVWHYLCNAKVVGRDKARAAFLKIGNDKRVPMMVVYKMFKGEAKPEDVAEAAEAGKVSDDERSQRRFYARLYLGLWYESEDNKKEALVHLKKAAKMQRVGRYMADVARVDVERLEHPK